MPKHLHERPSSSDTRQLLAHLIAAREQYSIFLREVATGKRLPDIAEKELLKMQCEETLYAWRAAHEAWRLASTPLSPPSRKRHSN